MDFQIYDTVTSKITKKPHMVFGVVKDLDCHDYVLIFSDKYPGTWTFDKVYYETHVNRKEWKFCENIETYYGMKCVYINTELFYPKINIIHQDNSREKQSILPELDFEFYSIARKKIVKIVEISGDEKEVSAEDIG